MKLNFFNSARLELGINTLLRSPGHPDLIELTEPTLSFPVSNPPALPSQSQSPQEAPLMQTTDFDSMDSAELTKMRAELDAALARKKQDSLRKLVMGCAEAIAATGNSPAEFIEEFTSLLLTKPAAAGQRKRGAGRTTYKDPASAATWTGKGKAPGWMAAHLAAGGKKEDLKVA